MTAALRMTALDLRVLAAVARSMLAVAVVLAVITWITAPTPAMMVAVFLFAAAILAVDPFRSDERANLDALYATLPLSRHQVVAGRYLTTLVILAVSALTGLTLGTIAALTLGHPLQPGVILTVLTAGFLFDAVILAVELPLLFAVGYARARWVTLTPMLIIGVAILVTRSIRLPLTEIVEAVQQTPPAALVVTGLLLGLGLLGASGLLAARVYDRRDL